MHDSKTVLCLPIMLAALSAGVQASVQTSAPAAASPYAPLAYRAGHCWQGMLPGGKDADTHCFSWVYDNKFARDQHTVHGAGHADHLGESIYYWDSARRKLQYLYVESDGGSSRGTVEASGDALVFPITNFQEDGQIRPTAAAGITVAMMPMTW